MRCIVLGIVIDLDVQQNLDHHIKQAEHGKTLIVNGQESLFFFKEGDRLLARYRSDQDCYVLLNSELVKITDPPFGIPALSKIKVSIGGGGYVLIEVTTPIRETERQEA